MKALLLSKTASVKEDLNFLQLVDMPIPTPGKDEVLIKISACGICHTELDEIEGRTSPPVYPVIPGHQVIGTLIIIPDGLSGFSNGDRVGVAWIYSSCEKCNYCKKGLQNLCDYFLATGRDRNGGYAEYMTAHRDYIYKIPDFYSNSEAAPLLCAGAIGYRSLKLTNVLNGQNIGLTGFGASGHLVLKMIRYLYPDSKTYVFARSEKERLFASENGAYWTGDTTDDPNQKLQTIIDTTPAWKPVTEGLKHLAKGGRLVINAIRKEEADKHVLMDISYEGQLWMEKEIKSVTNITPSDVREFLDLAVKMKLKPEIQEYALEQAETALRELKSGIIRGAKVIVMP